jgi:3',5'-cyclic AMP phosphodiesterase CpdA
MVGVKEISAHSLSCILAALTAFFIAMAPACRSGSSAGQVSAGETGNQSIPAFFNGDIASRNEIPLFILVGDTQRTSAWELLAGREQNDAARQLVLEKIADEDPAFLIILGDLVFQGDDPRHWDMFDQVTAKIRLRGIPAFPVVGNHEYFGNHNRAFDLFFNRFPHLHRQLWSSFRFGPIAVILLNSNFEHLHGDSVDQQDAWYRARLSEYQSNSAIKTIVVCCHHAPFTNSTVVSDDWNVQQHFVEPFKNASKAKLFFTGHCHSYERFVQFGKQFIVSGGGGGPRQALIVDPKTRKHEDQYNGGEIREFHYCKVTLEGEHVRVQMIKIDDALNNWSTGDEFVVE